eukprot:TRINITY_DN9329_c0_g1_i6.p1 TRINITY_DN9329_c0_g1~~TRINITY_DN9329_c0_g1_i6.p1  ORF type:complete len:500 (-),score=73.99 TRINITY_DN9329_c0_g1_i6:127-1554(-)
MPILILVLLSLLLVPTLSSSNYAIIDGENSIKAFVPRILNSTNAYFARNPSFPDIVDHKRKLEYLGLANNKWVNVNISLNSSKIVRYEVDPVESTISMKAVDVGTYEATSEYNYNWMIVAYWGEVRIKGNIDEVEAVFELVHTANDNNFTIQAVSVKTKLTLTSLKLDESDDITDWFAIKQFINETLSSNFHVLANSFANAINQSTIQFFSSRYPNNILWKFTTLGGESQWTIDNIFVGATLDLAGELVVAYNTGIPTRDLYDPDNIVKIRQYNLGTELVKSLLESAYRGSGRVIVDADVPKEMQDRLDIVTFEKLVPAAALKSIKQYGPDNNQIEIEITPQHNLNYFLEEEEHQQVLGAYTYTVTNKGERLITGSVEILFTLVTTWRKEDSLGYLNIKLKKGEVIGSNVIPAKYPVITERFKKFLHDVGAALFSRIKGKELIDKGIVINDTMAPYGVTEVYWDKILDQIVVEHH